jgi:putative flippase GtrA
LKVRDPSRLAREAWLFTLVGAIGFCVDGGLLLVGHEQLGFAWPFARLLSFTGAVTVTWLLNRSLTFSNQSGPLTLDEWRRYFAVNGVGAALNLGIFSMLMEFVPSFSSHPLIALAVAATVALTFNFFMSRRLVFQSVRAGQTATDHD